MKNFTYLFFSFFAFLSLNVSAQCNLNLLNNPGFDSPVQAAIGNNLTGLTTFNGWSITGGPFNIIKTDGTVYGGGPDNAQNGNQYVDITSAGGTIYQDFTVAGATKPIAFSGYFSSREQGVYIDWTASIDIVDLGTGLTVASSNTRLFTNADGAVPNQDAWYFLYGNANLPVGNYRYLVNLGDFGNFDAAFVAQNCVLSNAAVSLTGSYGNSKVILNWNAAAAQNLSRFEIERSVDGRTFSAIGFVDALTANTYNYTDVVPPADSRLFYRLKIKKADGTVTYSNTISVSSKATVAFTISPNPVINTLTLSGLTGAGGITITDVSGRIIRTFTQRNVQSAAIDVSTLKSGFYFITCIHEGVKTAKRFIKN